MLTACGSNAPKDSKQEEQGANPTEATVVQQSSPDIDDLVGEMARYYAASNKLCDELTKGELEPSKKDGQAYREYVGDALVARFRLWKADGGAAVLCVFLSDYTTTGPGRDRMDFWRFENGERKQLPTEKMVPGIELNERVEICKDIDVYYSDSQLDPDYSYVWNGVDAFIRTENLKGYEE